MDTRPLALMACSSTRAAARGARGSRDADGRCATPCGAQRGQRPMSPKARVPSTRTVRWTALTPCGHPQDVNARPLWRPPTPHGQSASELEAGDARGSSRRRVKGPKWQTPPKHWSPPHTWLVINLGASQTGPLHAALPPCPPKCMPAVDPSDGHPREPSGQRTASSKPIARTRRIRGGESHDHTPCVPTFLRAGHVHDPRSSGRCPCQLI